MAFSLPPDISFQKELSNNTVIYTFRHQTLGELGRLVLQDTIDGQCHISSEVVGDPDDPMTATRLDIFKPLTEQLTQVLDAELRARGKTTQATGPSSLGATIPSSPPLDQERVASKLIPCPRCGQPAAMLIFADQARDVGQLEDYARKMYSTYKQLNLPTWILGAPQRLPDNDISCATFQVWPKRGPVQELRSDDFNQQVDQMLDQHCS